MEDPLKGVVDICEAIRGTMPKFEELSKRSTEFGNWIREKIKTSEREHCIEHECEILEFDEDKTYSASWRAGGDSQKEFIPQFKDCHLCAIEKKKANEGRRWVKCGIPSKVLHATFENFIATDDDLEMAVARRKVIAKFDKQIKLNKGFIIAIGLYGTGKSHLSAATIKRIGGGMFITLADMIGELRQTYSDNSGQDELVEKYRTAKVLVLDELATEVKGVDIGPLLYRILGHRYDKDLLTILTSNEPLEVCLEILGGKLRDRLRDSYTVANFTWKSQRGQK